MPFDFPKAYSFDKVYLKVHSICVYSAHNTFFFVKRNRQGFEIFSDPQHRWAKSTPPSRHCDHKICLKRRGWGFRGEGGAGGLTIFIKYRGFFAGLSCWKNRWGKFFLHLLAVLDSGPKYSSGMCVCVYLCVVVLIDPDGTLLWHCVTAGSGQVWQILLLQCTRTNKQKGAIYLNLVAMHTYK